MGLVCCLSLTSVAQKTDTTQSIKKERVIVFSESAVGGLSLAGLSAIWYDEPATKFHGFDDRVEWLQLDKVGHFTTSYQIVRVNSELLSLIEIPEDRAVKYSLFQTVAYMSVIEVLDGFAPSYGASFSDLGANLGGAFAYYLQYRTGQKELFNVKYSFRQSGLSHLRPALLGSNPWQTWLKDYNGQTYWLSVNLNKATAIEQMPKWLNLAIGYGGKGMLGGKFNPFRNEAGTILPKLDRTREWSLSFDVDLGKLFPKKSKINRAFRLVSFLKIPLPGVTFSNGSKPEWRWFSY